MSREHGSVRAMVSAPVFEATRSPYLVVDRALRICAVNTAYEQATGQSRDALLGREMFEAFPDNPADPVSRGVAHLTASFEHVLQRGQRHHMGVQRYDVPDPHDRDRFAFKVWAPVNSPVIDAGRTVAVLHHVEDLTGLLPALDDEEAADRTPSVPLANVADSWVRLAAAAHQARLAARAALSEAEQLRRAVDTNRQISMAIGLLMARYDVSQHEAFETLRGLASRQVRKLHEVAVDIVQTTGDGTP